MLVRGYIPAYTVARPTESEISGERRWEYAETDILATKEFEQKSALLQVFLPDLCVLSTVQAGWWNGIGSEKAKTDAVGLHN